MSSIRRARLRGQRQPRVAQHHAAARAAVVQEREVAVVAGDPLDRRIDLVERPALSRPGVGGQRADAQADAATAPGSRSRGSASITRPNGPVRW